MRFLIELYIFLSLLVAPTLVAKEFGMSPSVASLSGMLIFLGVLVAIKVDGDEG